MRNSHLNVADNAPNLEDFTNLYLKREMWVITFYEMEYKSFKSSSVWLTKNGFGQILWYIHIYIYRYILVVS